MSLIDLESLRSDARKEINEELNKKAKAALLKKYRAQADAEMIVANIKREIADLEQSIIDGSFTG